MPLLVIAGVEDYPPRRVGTLLVQMVASAIGDHYLLGGGYNGMCMPAPEACRQSAGADCSDVRTVTVTVTVACEQKKQSRLFR